VARGSRDLRSWSAPLRVPGGSVNANPGVAVDAAGTVVVGYLARRCRASATSPTRTRSGTPTSAVLRGGRLTSVIASTEPVHNGALCYRAACSPATADPVSEVEANAATYRETGPVRVALTPNGDLHVVFAMTPDTGVNRGYARRARSPPRLP